MQPLRYFVTDKDRSIKVFDGSLYSVIGWEGYAAVFIAYGAFIALVVNSCKRRGEDDESD